MLDIYGSYDLKDINHKCMDLKHQTEEEIIQKIQEIFSKCTNNKPSFQFKTRTFHTDSI